MIQFLSVMNTLVFAFLFVIWQRKTWLDLTIKAVMFICLIVNLLHVLQLSGYIVKIGG